MIVFIYFVGMGVVICWGLGVFNVATDPDLRQSKDK